MSKVGIIVGKLASFHEAYYRRYILFCPFYRVQIEPVVVYESGHEKISLFCMASDVRLIKTYYDKPQVSVIAKVSNPEKLSNIADYLLSVDKVEEKLDLIKANLILERYRMEIFAETMISENFHDEYSFIMDGYNRKPIYTRYFNANCFIDAYVNACLHKCLGKYDEEPSIIAKSLCEIQFHPVEVVKLLQGKTTPREIIGGAR